MEALFVRPPKPAAEVYDFTFPGGLGFCNILGTELGDECMIDALIHVYEVLVFYVG